MQPQKKSKCALWLLLGAQTVIVIGFYCFAGDKAAWSALAGGGANTAGQVYFLLKTYSRPKVILAPKAALGYFYKTELLKIALIFSLLALLLSVFRLDVWIVFVTFVVAQCLGSFAPLCTFRHQ